MLNDVQWWWPYWISEQNRGTFHTLICQSTMDRASPLHHRQGFPSPPWTGLPLSTMDRASPLHHRQGFDSPPWTGLPLSTIWRRAGQLCWLSHIQRIKQYLTVYLIRLRSGSTPQIGIHWHHYLKSRFDLRVFSNQHPFQILRSMADLIVRVRLGYMSVMSLDVDLRNGHRFENLIWVLHIVSTCLLR